MKKSNNRGFTLIEMLLVLAIICIMLPLIYQLYIFGQETFTYNSRLIAQQYTVTNVMSHIRSDIRKAAVVSVENTDDEHSSGYPKIITLKLGYIDTDPGSPAQPDIYKIKYWRFYCEKEGDEGVLQYSGEKDPGDAVENGDYNTVVTGLDIMNCKFERLTESSPECDYLTVQIKPLETNTGKANARNVREPIKTEISVLYKDEL